MKIKTYVSAIALLGIILCAVDSYSISPITKSTQDYGLTLTTLRHVNIMIENFGDEQMKKKFTEVKDLFKEAGENFY
jgi:phage anti-repressor protein